MECSDIKYKIQALADNELDEKEIETVMDHIQSCYNCRNEYIDFLKLQKKLQGIGRPEPEEEWFVKNRHRWKRNSISLTGRIFFLASYLLLVFYAVYSLFMDKSTDLLVKLSVGGIILGLLFLAGVTLADRIRENRTDKYKGVIR